MRRRRPMTCERFAAWLDAGMPPDGAAAALEHAAGCTECTLHVAAASELEMLLGNEPPAAPAAFTAAVMARVTATRPPTSLLPTSPLPWWVRAAADPASALALVASALLLWGIDRIPAIAGAIDSMRNAAMATLGAQAPRLLDAGIWSAVVVSLAPALIVASLELYRWSVWRVHDAAGSWR